MASGLDKVSQALKKHRGDVLLTIATLATAENKWKAIGATIKDFAIYKMIGPLGIVLGLTTGLASAFRAVVKETGSLEAALQRMATIRGLERQFAVLLQSTTRAKERVAELLNVFDRGRFSMESVSEGARALERMTDGAFAGRKAMEAVSDAATATNNDFDAVANAVGRLSEELRNGGDVSGAVDALRDMGVVSGTTAKQMKELHAAGVGSGTIFGMAVSEIERFSGATLKQKDGITGLRVAYEKAKAALMEKLGAPFTESEEKATAAMVSILQSLAPVVEGIARFIAPLVNLFADASQATLAWVLSSKLVQDALVLAAKAVTTLAAGMVALGTAMGLRSLVSFVAGVVNMSRQVGVAATAVANFDRAQRAAAVGSRAFGAGMYGSAAACARTAVACGVAGTAMRALGVAIKLAVASTVIGAAILLIQTLGDAVYEYFTRQAEGAKKAKEFANETREMVSALQEQVNAIKSVADQQKALADATNETVAAYRKWRDVSKDPKSTMSQSSAAFDRYQQLQKVRDAVKARKDLELLPEQTEAGRASAMEARRQERVAFDDAMGSASPDAANALRDERASMLEERAKAGFEAPGRRAKVAQERAAIEQEIKDLELLRDTTNNDVDRKSYEKAIYEKQAQMTGVAVAFGSKSQSLMGSAAQAQAALDYENASGAEKDRLFELGKFWIGKSSPRKVQELREQAYLADYDEGNATGYKEEAEGLRRSSAGSRRDEDRKSRELEMEKQIVEAKETGLDLAEKEWAVRRRFLEGELSKPENAGATAQQGILNAIASGDRDLRATRRAAAVSQMEADRAAGIQGADMAGDTRSAMAMEDLDRFAKRLEEFRGMGMGDGQAQEYARRASLQDIELDDFDRQRNAVADSMARIGGGGGVAHGDPVLSVAQRQEELQSRMVEYLAAIKDKVGPGSDPRSGATYPVFAD